MAKWPAVDVSLPGDHDLALAASDDFAPTAAESFDDRLRVFFPTSSARNAARAALAAAGYAVEPLDVDDEDWARRSQEGLQPITVGHITIVPRSALVRPAFLHPAPYPPGPCTAECTIVIQPSMGFGTGHHATTRLCLLALQTLSLTNLSVLDVGTGSGILALAAARLGAAAALGIDCDADAIQAANENLALDRESRARFLLGDLASADVEPADVLFANLTGALLARSAPRLLGLLRPGGVLIVSGLLEEERDAVCRAFAAATVTWDACEAGWVAMAMKKP